MSTKKILSPIPKKRRNFIIAVTLLLAGMIYLVVRRTGMRCLERVV